MKSQDIINGVKAGYSFFYLQTFEQSRAIAAIKDAIDSAKTEDLPLSLKVWDLEEKADNPDPIEAIREVDTSAPWTVHLLKNFSWLLGNDQGFNFMLAQMIQNREDSYSSEESSHGRKIVVIMGNTSFEKSIPLAIQKNFMLLEFGLPDAEEIRKTIDFIIESVKENPKFKQPEDISSIVDASRGMTMQEIKNALSFSLVKHEGKIERRTIAELRSQAILKTAGLHFLDCADFSFDMLKGMENLKNFGLRTVGKKNARGMILLGPAGTGKTMFAKCLGAESRLDVYLVELAELFGGIVGETEAKTKTLIEALKSLSPCIVIFDEIEKMLAGTKSGSQSGDSGTTKRAMAMILKFMSDPKERQGIYCIATCNDIASLDAAWVRAERWDGVFFLDLPSRKERNDIFTFYKKVYNVKGEIKDSEGWSGAEIQTCCRLASVMGVENIAEVEDFIIPISKTMSEEIGALRAWALDKDGGKLRAIPASAPMKLKAVNGSKRAVKM